MFSGCSISGEHQDAKAVKLDMSREIELDYGDLSNVTLRIVTIDSCEYIFQPYGYGAFLTHRGRCKFCEQRAKINK